MKNDIVQSAQSAFAITFTSANPNEYPVIYAEDQWHTANKSDKICTLYDKLHTGSNTSATGAQFTQREINETLANTVQASQSSVSSIKSDVATLRKEINNINTGIVNVYRFKGSVDTFSDLYEHQDTAKVGDVYNVKDTGMNYAFIGGQTLYIGHDTTTGGASSTMKGTALRSYAETCYNSPQPEDLYVQDRSCNCTLNATKDDSGHYKLYAVIGTPTEFKDKYVNLESYDEKLGYYKVVSDTVVYYTISKSDSETWDALGESQSLTLWEE